MEFYTSIVRSGNKFLVRGYRNGKSFKSEEGYKPYLFFPCNKETGFKTLEGQNVQKKVYEDMSAAWNNIRDFERAPNFKYFGFKNFLYTFINDTFPGKIEYDVTQVRVVSIDIEVDSRNGFPRPEVAKDEVTAITLSKVQHGETQRVIFGLKPYKPKKDNTFFVLCNDEDDLLKRFVDLWADDEWMPDVVTGWNIEGFDIPYLVNRITNILGSSWVKKLSPWKVVREVNQIRGKTSNRAAGTSDKVMEIVGVTSLDYLELYKKFSPGGEESYKLDNIAFVVLGERKVDYSEYGNLNRLYDLNPELYYDYNLDDTIKIERLEEKLGYIRLVMHFAYDAKVLYLDTMTTTRPWDVIIHNYLFEKGIVVGDKTYSIDDEAGLVGGYVKPVEPGKYKWVVNFDFDSLYPHIIMQQNISPEKFVGIHEAFSKPEAGDEGIDDEKILHKIMDNLGTFMAEGNIICANGAMFKRDEVGFLPALMDKMYQDRKAYKKIAGEYKKKFQESKNPEDEKLASVYDGLQYSKKIQLNSGYGALAEKRFRWFSTDYAEAVTSTGQLATKFVERMVNEYLNKALRTDGVQFVVAADTDSIYVALDPLVQQFCKDFDTDQIVIFLDNCIKGQIQKVIDKSCERFANLLNAPTCRLHMKREAIAEAVMWKAKKMYAMWVWDMEGLRYKEPQLKVKGIEAVRSSTPLLCREAIKEALKIMLGGTEKKLQAFVKDFKKKFMTANYVDISFPRGCNNLDDWFCPQTGGWMRIPGRNIPIHVRASLTYNKWVRDNKLEHKYVLIKDGSKTKWCYLRLPNPLKEEVIAAPEDFPEEMNLQEHVDYNLQFEKSFINPIESFARIIGWQSIPGNNLLKMIGNRK